MTDAISVYLEDITTRSRNSKGIHHKNNGSAVTKLGNREYTSKEIMEKHSPCITYPEINSLMNFSEFERLPNDLKIEFINQICDKYDIDIKHISRILFNKGDDGLRANLRKWKIKDPTDEKKTVSLLSQCQTYKNRGKTGLLRFEADVREFKRRDAIAKEIDKEEAKKKQESLPSFMTFEEFRKIPLDSQVVYINSLIEAYQIPSKYISLYMFEKNENWISNYFINHSKNNEIIKLPYRRADDREKMSESKKRFKRLIEAWKDFSEDDPIDISPVEEVVSEPVKEEKMIETVPEVSEEVVSDGVSEQLETLTEAKPNYILKSVYEEEEEPEPEPDPFVYHEMHFTSEYIHNGLDEEEFNLLDKLVGEKKVKVRIEITEV